MGKKLENFVAAEFLRECWQKKPTVIRQGISNFVSPISADELAGLSLEDEVESRLIIEHGDTPWTLRHGPFDEEVFSTLPESHWTMLVQSVEHWVPEVNALLEYFQFLPRWRLEDIMISYAVDGGNVGPHYDNFDVFLIQAEGKRRWQVGPVYDDSAPVVADTPLHILSEFSSEAEYVMGPGDILYLPPGFGHHGVAEGECMTISIGFRAPSHREILMGFTDYVSDQLGESLRYSDPDQRVLSNTGLIDEHSIQRVQDVLQQYINDKALVAQWFGAFMTEPKHQQEQADDITDWSLILEELEGADLMVSEGSRLAFYKGNCCYAFVDGEKYDLPLNALEWVEVLCKKGALLAAEWSCIEDQRTQQWLLELVQKGGLYFD
ncbi:cupin domain-containing protein [uncultured Endozoicomonas sp.]|uniref:cupin domain-containing protein n=1 Tax=uncultured Endozoicomonas sp. TaxID=432652 RepID=UPI002636D3B9|nr:cupin domain-containing protein [uncultured Endozoicomonas sp.]